MSPHRRSGHTPEGGHRARDRAWLGALTRALLVRASRVIAVDRDRDMIAFLEGTWSADLQTGKLTLQTADGLAIDWAALVSAALPPPSSLATCPTS